MGTMLLATGLPRRLSTKLHRVIWTVTQSWRANMLQHRSSELIRMNLPCLTIHLFSQDPCKRRVLKQKNSMLAGNYLTRRSS